MGNAEAAPDGSERQSAIIFPEGYEPRQLERLSMKLSEYNQWQIAMPDMAAVQSGAATEEELWYAHHIFKVVVLRVVLDLAEAGTRDTLDHPITLGEVADYFWIRTNIDVSGAVSGSKAIPFEYNPEAKWHLPNFAATGGKMNTVETLFVGAYAVIRAYAANGSPRVNPWCRSLRSVQVELGAKAPALLDLNPACLG